MLNYSDQSHHYITIKLNANCSQAQPSILNMVHLSSLSLSLPPYSLPLTGSFKRSTSLSCFYSMLSPFSGLGIYLFKIASIRMLSYNIDHQFEVLYSVNCIIYVSIIFLYSELLAVTSSTTRLSSFGVLSHLIWLMQLYSVLHFSGIVSEQNCMTLACIKALN